MVASHPPIPEGDESTWGGLALTHTNSRSID